MPVEYRDCHPYWYYRNVPLADRGVSLGTQHISFRIKSGFNYWLRGLFIGYPHAITVAGPDDVSPIPEIALVQYERNRMITEIPIPCDIFSNPGGSKPTPPGHQQHARQLHNGWIRWNYLISNSDAIVLRVSGHANGNPSEIRIAIMGHNVKAEY